MTTDERLEALERGLSVAKRRNKYLLIGLVVFALAFGFTITTETVQAQPDENIIRAERFEVVDSQGNTRATLGIEESVPGLKLYDENGELRTHLVVSDVLGPALFLSDENGELRTGLGVVEGFGPGLSLYDENGEHRAAHLTVTEDFDSGTYLNLYDENGEPRAGLVVSDDGGPMLGMADENGDTIWSAP